MFHLEQVKLSHQYHFSCHCMYCLSVLQCLGSTEVNRIDKVGRSMPVELKP